MPALDKVCLAVLVLFLLAAVVSYLPAMSSFHWLLRVGVPEVGMGFLVLALPAALVLGRTNPKLSGGLFALLLTLLLVSWAQAVGVAGDLTKRWLDSFAVAPTRYPLRLGDRGGHTLVTERYKGELEWDRYIPKGREPFARLLFIHGGSWRNGTRKDYDQIFCYLADRGYEVLSPTYTLSGTAPYPEPYFDIQAAIERAHQEGVPLFLGGRSSGGHLALLSAYRNPELVDGVIGFYPPVDMKWSYDNPSNPHVLNSQEAIVEFLGAGPGEEAALYRETSPLFQATGQGPPTLLIHGRPDCLVYHRQSEMLSQRLEELGVEHFLLSLPWAEHGGDVTLYGPTGRLSTWAIEGFLESRVRELNNSQK